jgi:hypothetical protein
MRDLVRHQRSPEKALRARSAKKIFELGTEAVVAIFANLLL